ncbi:MAG: hypothetical protein WKF89_01510 [Chitinophagaceae bacterium]
MKKSIPVLVTILMMIYSAGFAASTKDNVNEKVLAAFSEKFTTAKQVLWIKTDRYLKATFIYNDQYLFAYFSEAGDYIGISRNLKSGQLPINLQTSLKKYLEEGWIKELFEFSGDNETTYFATIQNADNNIIIKSTGSNSWSSFKRTKRTK